MISFVYFDVGGVVIKDFSNTNKWHELKEDLGVNPDTFEAIWSKYENEVCIGRDVDTLMPINKMGYSLLEDVVGRFEQNPSIWPIIEKVHQKVRVGLLTNMYPRMLEVIRKNDLLPQVKWDVIIDSSIEKCQKPETKIFEIAAERCGEKPENTLFIDNGAMHVEAAKKFGFKTFLYDSGDYEGSSKKLNCYVSEQIYTSEVSPLHHLGGVNL